MSALLALVVADVIVWNHNVETTALLGGDWGRQYVFHASVDAIDGAQSPPTLPQPTQGCGAFGRHGGTM